MRRLFTAILLLLAAASGPAAAADKTVVRIGFFPNVTHVHALVAQALAAKGDGFFEQRLGPDVELQWYPFNAGPSAMEAIFAGSLDVTYVGPNPVINAYAKSDGEEMRVLSGAVTGGAALVVQGDGRIKTAADFRGRKLATPQLGNTQDVAARAWLKANGYAVTQLGGDVLVVPTENANLLTVFGNGDVDAAWTVEPWVARLELETNGKVFLEQKDSVTTILASSTKFATEHAELADKLVAAHRELTGWINQHQSEAKELVRAQLKTITKREFPAEVLERSWPRLTVTNELPRATLDMFVDDAVSAGFLKSKLDLGRLLERVH